MVSQLSICFFKLLWHGRHGLRVVLVHSWTDHVSAHNAVYFWLCTGFGENRNNHARGVLFWKMLDLCTCECYIHFRVNCQSTLIKNSATASHFQILSSVSNKCKPSMRFLLCHMDKVTQQANILIRIRSLFVRFTWSPYLEPWQQFQNILTRRFSTMSVRGRKRDLGVEYQNIKNPIIIAKAKLPRSILSHFWGLGWDSRGKWFSQALSGRKRWRWMVQTCLQVCCLPWPIFDRRHLS